MECNVVKKNLGLSRCNALPGLLKGMITTPPNFVIPAATLADPDALLDFLNDAILGPLATRIYFWADFVGFENVSEEAVYEETPLGYLPVRDGNYRFKFTIRQNICYHKAMFTHRATNGRVIFVDNENQLLLSENAAGDGVGFTIQALHTEKFQFNDGSVSTKSPVLVALSNNKELDKTGLIVTLDSVGELYRIVDVALTIVGSPSATTIVVDVAAVCDGTEISGLVVADFSVIDNADSLTHAITSAVESSTIPGRYTLTGVAFEDSTLNLVATDDLTIQAYESTGAVAVNVP